MNLRGGERNKMATTLFKKSVTTKLQRAKVSPHKARRMKLAIKEIESLPIDTLCKSGKVTRINIKGQNNLYAYRVNSSDRIVFSTDNDHRIVQDIVDTNAMKIKG